MEEPCVDDAVRRFMKQVQAVYEEYKKDEINEGFDVYYDRIERHLHRLKVAMDHFKKPPKERIKKHNWDMFLRPSDEEEESPKDTATEEKQA